MSLDKKGSMQIVGLDKSSHFNFLPCLTHKVPNNERWHKTTFNRVMFKQISSHFASSLFIHG